MKMVYIKLGLVARAMATLGLAIMLMASQAQAASEGRPGYGLIGYGITMYSPRCAYACQSAIPKMLDCPDDPHSHHDMKRDMGMDSMAPSPECLATNPNYLQSLAWCIHTHCDNAVADIPALEEWWVLNVAGVLVEQPIPNITYQEAVLQVDTPPKDVLGEHEVMNRTVLADEEAYTANDNIYDVFEQIETSHSTLSMIVFITGAVIPIALSLLRLIPWPAALLSRFNAIFIDPPAFGSRHATPIKNMATVPTRGQAIFIAYLIAINVIASSVSIKIAEPNAWYTTSWYQVAVYISNRTGALSFANIPLLILFSSRNNLLLWLTDWSHGTFLLLHRYVAWLCTLEACIHSAIYLHLYLWKQTHAEEATLPYWYWGIIGTLALSLLLVFSIRPIRSSAYELFRILHIVLAIITIVGSWYHIIYRYEHRWGYETWLYMAIAIWAFDRIARVVRLARNGLHRGYVSQVGDDYICVSIPNVEATGHVYAYFPTLNWRMWENHPFSVVSSVGVPTSLGNESADVRTVVVKSGVTSNDKELPIDITDHGKNPVDSHVSSGRALPSPGITLFIRTHGGVTSQLASRIGLSSGVPVLIESSYGHESTGLLSASSTTPNAQFPNTICIAGGVGITAVLPSLAHTLSLLAPLGTTKLFWGVRQTELVEAVESLVADVRTDEKSGQKWWLGRVETQVAIGERLNLREILDQELSSGKGTTVIVSGPGGMADDVRTIVSGLGRGNAVVRYVEESFTW